MAVCVILGLKSWPRSSRVAPCGSEWEVRRKLYSHIQPFPVLQQLYHWQLSVWIKCPGNLWILDWCKPPSSSCLQWARDLETFNQWEADISDILAPFTSVFHWFTKGKFVYLFTLVLRSFLLLLFGSQRESSSYVLPLVLLLLRPTVSATHRH